MEIPEQKVTVLILERDAIIDEKLSLCLSLLTTRRERSNQPSGRVKSNREEAQSYAHILVQGNYESVWVIVGERRGAPDSLLGGNDASSSNKNWDLHLGHPEEVKKGRERKTLTTRPRDNHRQELE